MSDFLNPCANGHLFVWSSSSTADAVPREGQPCICGAVRYHSNSAITEHRAAVAEAQNLRAILAVKCDTLFNDHERLLGELTDAEAELARFRRDYAIFEQLAPPDLSRGHFVALCYYAWEYEASREKPSVIFRLYAAREIIKDMAYLLHNSDAIPDEQQRQRIERVKAYLAEYKLDVGGE